MIRREFQYVFGPVPSRRLGRSLGVNPIPFKTCNYSCVYCQLGRTSNLTIPRRNFFPPEEILDEIRRALELHRGDVDYVTFSGEGEPTLCEGLGELIYQTKQMTDLPVAVLTNGSLLSRRDVRKDLTWADVVMPSLDAADQETFRAINRPHGMLKIAAIVDGMARFRRRFGGKLWIEVMLVRGLNDREDALREIQKALEWIAPDRVYLNTPIRPPAESWVEPPDVDGFVRADLLLGNSDHLDRLESGTFSTIGFDDPLEAVLMIIRRHPMREDQLRDTLSAFPPEVLAEATRYLEAEGELQRIHYRDRVYFTTGYARYVEARPQHVRT